MSPTSTHTTASSSTWSDYADNADNADAESFFGRPGSADVFLDETLELGPRNQFLAPELVLTEMARAGAERACRRSGFEVAVLSIMAGAFITIERCSAP